MNTFPTLRKLPRIILLALLIYAFGNPVQNETITGTVYDDSDKPMANVEVVNLSNHSKTVSNKRGKFTIKGKLNDRLKFMLHGRTPREITAYKTRQLNVYFGYEKDSEVTVTGTVSDESGTLPGANVMVKGTTRGVQTDIDGKYSIRARIGEKLVFSFVGMSDRTITVNSAKINARLDSGVKLEEVVISGYSGNYSMDYAAPKKKMPAASTTTVTHSSIGKVAGVALSPAGEAKKSDIVIRGMASVSGKGAVPASTVAESVKSADADLKHIRDTGKADEEFTTYGTGISPGQLTAGEVNDFSKWTYWEDLTREELHVWQQQWQLSPTFRYSMVLANNEGFAVADKPVFLIDEKGNKIWSARTDNTGRAELWYHPEKTDLEKAGESLTVADADGRVIAKNPKEFHQGINTFAYPEKCRTRSKVNIAFMVDATGSMGDEIKYLQSELYDVIERTKKALPDSELSMGCVFYRDFSDDYLVRDFDFSEEIPDVISFIGKQSAGGGGDFPEAVPEGFETAIDSLHWDGDARARLLFVLLDAPPHQTPGNVERLQKLARHAAEKGIRIVPVAASGIDKSTEYLMRALALQTNGTYLFITNHSGIGNDHIEPSTDSYKVEMLNDLLLRIIMQFTATGDCKRPDALPVNQKMDAQSNDTKDIKWRYAPNPTPGKVTVETDEEASGLSLFDTTGKLVLFRKEKARQYDIDLSGMPSAVYYLKVIVGEKTFYGKIIKRI